MAYTNEGEAHCLYPPLLFAWSLNPNHLFELYWVNIGAVLIVKFAEIPLWTLNHIHFHLFMALNLDLSTCPDCK